MTGNPKVDALIEQLCEHGCRDVLGYIKALTDGGDLEGQAAGLDQAERMILRDELQAIMNVYGNKCSL